MLKDRAEYFSKLAGLCTSIVFHISYRTESCGRFVRNHRKAVSQSGRGTTFIKRCHVLQVSPGLQYISTCAALTALYIIIPAGAQTSRSARVKGIKRTQTPLTCGFGETGVRGGIWGYGVTSHLILPEFSWMSGGQWKHTQDQEEGKTSGGSRRWSI